MNNYKEYNFKKNYQKTIEMKPIVMTLNMQFVLICFIYFLRTSSSNGKFLIFKQSTFTVNTLKQK